MGLLDAFNPPDSYSMYIYDSRPLKKKRFSATFIKKKVKLRSIYTGDVVTVPGAFYVDGVPIGCTFNEWTYGQLVKHGREFEVKCYIKSWPKKSWPEVRFYMPK